MERMQDVWHWVADHWRTWGLTAFLLAVSNLATWILSRRKDWTEWKASRQAKADKKIDAQVLQALGNPNLWAQLRPLTGAGVPLVRSAEIAQHLSLDGDIVGDSLERLEARGRVERTNGTFDNPSPYWHILFR